MNPSGYYDVIVAGGGQAGAQCAQSLRQDEFEGSILLLSDEAVAPYERPPLSKDYLAGKRDVDRLLLRTAEFWQEKKIVVQTGGRIEAVVPETHQVILQGGGRLTYGKLVWATGGRPRMPAFRGVTLPGVRMRSAASPISTA